MSNSIIFVVVRIQSIYLREYMKVQTRLMAHLFSIIPTLTADKTLLSLTARRLLALSCTLVPFYHINNYPYQSVAIVDT